MPPTRRQLLASLAFGAARAAAQRRPRNEINSRTSPALCLYSQVLVKVDYNDLGPILRGLGFDGCDLSVQPGGHVIPAQAGLNLMPAVEALTGAGLEVPMITTAFTSADQAVQSVLFLAGIVGVPLFRPGHWNLNDASLDLSKTGLAQQDMLRLASLAAGAGLSTAIQNFVDDQGGATVAGINSLLGRIDPKWVGYDFDIGYAAAQAGADGWQAALQMALPRLKVVTLRDFAWKGEGKTRRMAQCPLGQGVVDWPRFFSLLAGAKFTGPLTLHMEYGPKEELAAVRQDAQFVRKQINSAYPA